MKSINHEGKRKVKLHSEHSYEFSFAVKGIDVIKSSEASIIYEYLRNRSHPTLFRELHDDFGSGCDIDFFVICSERIEEIFCSHAVGAVVLGVDSDHRMKVIKFVSVIARNEAIQKTRFCKQRNDRFTGSPRFARDDGNKKICRIN